MPQLVGKPKPLATPSAGDTQVQRETQYVSQVYVNRRKVWEGQAATEDQAYQQAKSEKQKYESRGLNAVIVTRKSPS